ncbi:MAG: co-chaperone GroES [Calditrichia bacterium]
MKLVPMDDRVLVEILDQEEKTQSGLIIPDTAKEKPRTGKVVAVGTDEMLQEVIKEGDTILFAKFGGEEVNFDGKDYLILQRNDILAVVK